MCVSLVFVFFVVSVCFVLLCVCGLCVFVSFVLCVVCLCVYVHECLCGVS